MEEVGNTHVRIESKGQSNNTKIWINGILSQRIVSFKLECDAGNIPILHLAILMVDDSLELKVDGDIQVEVQR
jgi:hypothetical protein